ncbi:MAG: ABC transporter permease [Caldilineaceae bacterium]
MTLPVTSILRRFNRWAWLLLPVLLFLAIFFLYPSWLILQGSIVAPVQAPLWGLANFVRFFQTSVFSQVLVNTIRTAAVVTLLCLLIGYPYAYVMNRAGPRLMQLFLLALLLSLWSPLLVRTYAWTVILQTTGLVNTLLLELGMIQTPLKLMRNLTGVLIGMTYILLPLMVLPIYSVMRRIDRELVLAAQSLGAAPLRAFFAVFLPLSLPGVYTGVLLVFVEALSFYITPALLGSPRQMMLGELTIQQIQLTRDWGMGSTMAVIMLMITLISLGLVGWFVNFNVVLGGRGDVD